MPRGGKRAGAGRPATGAKQVASFTLSDEAQAKLAEIAQQQGTSKSGAVESLINERQSPMNPVLEFKNKVKSVETETLKTLDFLVDEFPISPTVHKTKEQESIEVDTMRWLVQRELDSRKAGELPYTWGEMYLALNIPKQFLD